MHYKESAGRLFELLIQNSTSSEFRKFLYRSRSTVLVTLLIVSASDDKLCSLEDILERIPRKLVSRTSVKYILDQGVNQKFYVKVKDNRDNRRRVYSLNTKYQQEILNLMESYQEIFKRVESISKGK